MERRGENYDQGKVDEVIEFIQFLTLTKCTLSGNPEPFEVLPHTRRIIEGIYGPRRANGTRQTRKCFATFGRKQAKTQIAAAIAAYEFFMGDEPMQEIYFAASSADQAARCYEAVRDMISADPELESLCKITDSIRKMVNVSNGNILKVLSADGKRQHGFNPSMVVFDELHAWTDQHRELHAALSTGSKSRREPLWLTITTAGTEIESLWGQEYEYAKQVQKGEVVDPSYLPIIYEVPRDADWTDTSLWPLALPLLASGHHKLEDYEEEFRMAQQVPAKQNEFRRLYLNQQTSSTAQWIPLAAWDSLRADLPDDALAGVPCWGGLDLSATRDLMAFSLCWALDDGSVAVKSWGYIPKDAVAERGKRDGVEYEHWARLGHIQLTAGNAADWAGLGDHVRELQKRYNIQAIGTDPWNFEYAKREWGEISTPVMSFRQGYQSMSPAIKRAERLIYRNQLKHDGNPALRWNMDCCRIKSDEAGNVKLIKPPQHINSRRIDMAVSMVMAIGISVLAEEQVPFHITF